MKRAAIMALLLFAGMGVAHAQQDDEKIDCNNAQNQADMNQCAYMDFDKADKQLNAVYKQALKSQADMDKQNAEFDENQAGAVKALKKAQRAWIDYRDGECAAEGFQARGGSMEPMLISGCKAKLTRQRTGELKGLADGLEQ